MDRLSRDRVLFKSFRESMREINMCNASLEHRDDLQAWPGQSHPTQHATATGTLRMPVRSLRSHDLLCEPRGDVRVLCVSTLTWPRGFTHRLHRRSKGSGSGPGRVTRCLGPRADSGKKNTRHNNLVRSLIERTHVQSKQNSNRGGKNAQGACSRETHRFPRQVWRALRGSQTTGHWGIAI